MKKRTVFIIVIISVLVFQIFAEGYFSFCEEVKTLEEKTEIKTDNCRKLLRTDTQPKAIHEYASLIKTAAPKSGA